MADWHAGLNVPVSDPG